MNWYKIIKISQNQKLIQIIAVWIQQSAHGNIQPDLAWNDIQTQMGSSIDSISLMNALNNAIRYTENIQKNPLNPFQSQFVESLRSYLDEEHVEMQTEEFQNTEAVMETGTEEQWM